MFKNLKKQIWENGFKVQNLTEIVFKAKFTLLIAPHPHPHRSNLL